MTSPAPREFVAPKSAVPGDSSTSVAAFRPLSGSSTIFCWVTTCPSVPERVRPDLRLVDAAQRALPGARVLPIGTSARVGGTTD